MAIAVPVSSCSRNQFLQNLSQSGLYSQDDVSRIAETFCDVRDGDEFASRLTAAGKLTPYQAEAIRDGRFSELLIGNYEILAKLGAGGMGTVFKARHRRMKRIVALKVMSRQLCQDEKSVQRFQREVETIARLSHPNVVLAFDADEAEIGHFLVMEFVDGRDLASLVQQKGSLPLRDAVSYVCQSALGLDYAHSQGIIHRDIKPANLLLDNHGVVKVTDLGLARLNEGSTATPNSGLTQAGGIVGTVDYMSPEQAIDSTTIDLRSDIYSLGCTLYFLLVGSPPYQGTSIMATLFKHRMDPIPSLSAVRNDVPAALEAAFRKMVAKNTSDRFQTMNEVVDALTAISLPSGGATMPPPPVHVASAGTLSGQNPSTSKSIAPLVDSSQTVALGSAAAPTAPSILLVEPSRTQAAIIRKYMQNLGIEPICVTSCADALEAVRKSRPDAVVSAMHLKDGAGNVLAERIAAEVGVNTFGFVLISSEEESQDIGTLSHVCNALVLHKPFTFESLNSTLNVVTKRTLVPLGPTAGPGLSDSKVKEPTKPSINRAALKVLIADDSSAARTHERLILEGLGFSHFVEVADGAQAVGAAAQNAFDLIVTDYNMPFMDGKALVGFLKQNPTTANVPVVMVTTVSDSQTLDAVRKLGIAAICPKEFSPETVRPIIERLFGGS